MAVFAGWITACIPHYRCHRYIARAVEGLLQQTYPWLRIVVINDGDRRPPWKELRHLNDPRLSMFDLGENRGPYFCAEVARLAANDPFFLIQDADDWSPPKRAENLLQALLHDGSSLAISCQPQFQERLDGSIHSICSLWENVVPNESHAVLTGKQTLTNRYCYRAPHHGLFLTSALGDIGGYFGGFHIGWDTLLTNLILMTGTISWTSQPLYYRLIRSDSLTHSSTTGLRSHHAEDVKQRLLALYDLCYEEYIQQRVQADLRSNFLKRLRNISLHYVGSKDRIALNRHADRLRQTLS
jgi:glycosyltransferase involved in cell wall biosynthesis